MFQPIALENIPGYLSIGVLDDWNFKNNRPYGLSSYLPTVEIRNFKIDVDADYNIWIKGTAATKMTFHGTFNETYNFSGNADGYIGYFQYNYGQLPPNLRNDYVQYNITFDSYDKDFNGYPISTANTSETEIEYFYYNEYEAIKLPSEITSNITYTNGDWAIDNTLTVKNGACLEFRYNILQKTVPGMPHHAPIINLGENAKIIIEPGGKIITSNGTPNNPIYFKRYYNNKKWDRITLKGDNNSFSWTIFDGGAYNIDNLSRGNTFTNCTFKNADRGFNAYQRTDNSWSSFKLSNCTVENNNWGVVAFSTYAEIKDCLMKNNTSYGLVLNNARIGNNSSYGTLCGLFINNQIYNNGGYGVYLSNNGVLWLGYGPYEGSCRIINNGSDEIYLADNSECRLYSPSYGGQSAIYDKNGNYYICNFSKTYDGEYYVAATVVAENNYWNSSTGPKSTNFYGRVDYTPYLTSDPTGGSLASLQTAGENSETSNEVLSSGIAAALSENNSSNTNAQSLLDVKNKILELKNQLNNKPYEISNARRLNELYQLLVDFDPNNKLSESSYLHLLIDKYIQELLSSNKSSEGLQLIGETAMLIKINFYYEMNDFTLSLSKISEYDKYIQNSDNRRSLLSTHISILEHQNRYSEALAVLEQLKEEVKGDSPYYTPPDYTVLEENLKAGLGIKSSSSQRLSKESLIVKEIPKEFAMHNNYPNPFNPITNIPFSLLENCYVVIEVYNILGQRVAVVADNSYIAGKHNVQFNGNNLASGLYIIRAQIKSQESSAKYNFIKKMMLIK